MEWVTSAIPSMRTRRRVRQPRTGNRRVLWATGWGLALALAMARPAAAESPVVVTGDTCRIPLGLHLEILEDETGELSFEQVRQADSRFAASTQKTPSFGFTDSVYWVRFRVENRSRISQWWLVLRYANMNRISLYRPEAEGYESIQTGNVLPAATREVPHHHFHFPLTLPVGLSPTVDSPWIYLRFENQSAMFLPLELWSGSALGERNQVDTLGLGIYYGVMLGLIFYNLLLLLSLRDSTYLYHVLHMVMATLTLAAFDGLGQRFLWPSEVPWEIRTVTFFMAANTATALQFARTMLRTHVLAPGIHRVLVPVTIAAVVLALAAFWLPYRLAIRPYIVLQFLAFCLILFVSWKVWRGGFRPARYFFASWLLFAIAAPSLVVLTRLLPALPAEWLDAGLRVGTAGFFFLFSLALAERIQEIQHEKEQAQAELLVEQREALRVKDLMNTALQDSQGELQSRNTELERYAYTVSHDLKAPVVTIKGFLGLLEHDLGIGRTDRAAQYVERVNAAADKMAHLLDDLLEMSRLGRFMGTPEPTSLSEVAAEAVDLVTGHVAERSPQIDVEQGMPTVAADRTRLLEVFQNLIENAVKFCREQTAPEIEIRATRNGQEVVCSVRDNGIGIAPRHHDRVFGLFDRLSPEGEGTGIGLALVKRIVEGHGGRIWIESEGDGKGSTFLFTLPAASPSDLSPSDLPAADLPAKT